MKCAFTIVEEVYYSECNYVLVGAISQFMVQIFGAIKYK